MELFASARPIEKVGTLNVWNYGPGTAQALPDRVRFADLFVPGCRSGDLLDVTFQYQISNKLTYDVENAWRLLLTQSPVGLDGQVSAPGRGYNIPPGMHHGPGGDSWRVVVPADGGWYVVALVYAGGSSLSKPGDVVTVDVGYSSLTALRFREV